MKRQLTFTLIFTIAILIGLAAIPTRRSTQQLIASNDVPLDGHQACQACLDGADAAWWQCVQDEAGGDIGDADCSSRRNDAISSCQTSYCNQTAQTRKRESKDSAFVALLGNVVPAGQCATVVDCDLVRSVCSDIYFAMFDLCVGTGHDAGYCAFYLDSSYRSCVTENSNGNCSPYKSPPIN